MKSGILNMSLNYFLIPIHFNFTDGLDLALKSCDEEKSRKIIYGIISSKNLNKKKFKLFFTNQR